MPEDLNSKGQTYTEFRVEDDIRLGFEYDWITGESRKSLGPKGQEVIVVKFPVHRQKTPVRKIA